jgi:hypothetical protein
MALILAGCDPFSVNENHRSRLGLRPPPAFRSTRRKIARKHMKTYVSV